MEVEIQKCHLLEREFRFDLGLTKIGKQSGYQSENKNPGLTGIYFIYQLEMDICNQ